MAGATSVGISPGYGSVKYDLAREDGKKGWELTLNGVLCMPQCPVNLISQARLNDAGIFHDNEDWTLYDKKTKRIVGYAP
ncbi:MAG: hypothetical protein MMC33_010601, partial [Icmadophila ericetorum]|nr:hypothetical protein [Icmadophila ericetorum]